MLSSPCSTRRPRRRRASCCSPASRRRSRCCSIASASILGHPTRPEADVLEDLLDLAHGEGARSRRPRARGSSRRSRPARLPRQPRQRDRARAPEVVPAVVGGDVAAGEDVRVDQVLRLHLAAREHGAARRSRPTRSRRRRRPSGPCRCGSRCSRCGRRGCRRPGCGVTSWRMRSAGRDHVLELLHVAAQVVHRGEAPHAAVGAAR